MQAVIILLFFIGMFFIVAGIYEQRFKTLKDLVRTEYKFIPRTLYDEAYSSTDLNAMYKNYFDSPDPWSNSTSTSQIKNFALR